AMLVFPDGSQRGTLGGGCVEAEVRQRALRGLAIGALDVHTFHLDDNYGWDDGLICGGRMSILADTLTAQRRPSVADYYRAFRELVEQGRGCTEAVVMADQGVGAGVGSRYLFNADGRVAAQILWPDQRNGPNGQVPEEVVRHLVPVQRRPAPSV